MSEANVDVVRRIYAAWEQGERAPRELIDDEIEYVNPDEAVEAGTHRGRSAFATALRAVGETFDEFSVRAEQFVDAGDRVVVVGVLTGRGQASGVPLERRQGYVWTLRDGKVIRFQWFNDPEDALRLVGEG